MENASGKIFPLFIVLLIVLYGSQALSSEMKEAYNAKIIITPFLIHGEHVQTIDSLEPTSGLEKSAVVFLIEQSTFVRNKDWEASTSRAVAGAFGETDLRYHLKLKTGEFVPVRLDFSSNLLYNYSYIINTPSKLLHNIKADFMLQDLSESYGFSLVVSKLVVPVFIAWDIMHAITGILLAVPMLFVGPLIGLLFHPIHSVVNLIPVLIDLFKTTWHAVAYLINLFK